jgi:hypothetical protein
MYDEPEIILKEAVMACVKPSILRMALGKLT